VQPYWERLQELKYDFINGDAEEPAARALRFTLSIPGVHTAIVGTTKPSRWQQNAQIVAMGALGEKEFKAIRARWQEIAKPEWVGQV